MFGESDLGESPRVPSPWEAILSVTPPKLVPEADQGNIEYKLQLLSPSPARFARLVTQLKWRLLEGGGQAYYELGVADSGALVGLRRSELERTLETLECMAGEIGASVVVVREIEVPKGLRVGVRESGRRRRCGVEEESPSPLTLDSSPGLFPMDSDPDVPALTLTPPITVSESEHSTDLEISTVYKPRPIRLSPSPSPSPHSNPITHSKPPKPKWFPKTKHPPPDTPPPHTEGYTNANTQHRQTKQQAKAFYRRLARDRRREEKRRLNSSYSPESYSPDSASTPNSVNSDQNPPHEHPRIHQDTQSPAAAAEELVHGLETLHVTVASTAAVSVPISSLAASPSESGESSPTSSAPSPNPSPIPTPASTSTSPSSSSTASTLPALSTSTNSTQHHIRAQHNADGKGDQDNANANANGCGEEEEEEDDDDGVRLIVEALVVRKLSLEEAFLDFGGFSLVS
jgi:hypothetical protein